MPALRWLVPILVCPACRGGLAFTPDDVAGEHGILAHDLASCTESYPVIDGIPRLLLTPHRAPLVRARRSWFEQNASRQSIAVRWEGDAQRDEIASGFDYEWARFSAVGTPELRRIFRLYFDQVNDSLLRDELIVLDAGCGAGRWAFEVASAGPRVIALDLGLSVELARSNTLVTGRVGCVQGDLRNLPLAPASVDWAYSLGVLHHIEPPDRALARIADAVRPGSPVLVYLYYALDGRGPIFRGIHAAVDAVRRRTSRLPRPFVFAFAWAMAVLFYWPLARVAKIARRLGLARLADALPLSFYAERSFRIMLNDSLDRFGTAIERRYTRAEMAALLRSGGFDEVSFSPGPPYWHALARVRSHAPVVTPSGPVR